MIPYSCLIRQSFYGYRCESGIVTFWQNFTYILQCARQSTIQRMKKYYSINVELTCGFSYMCEKTLIYDEIPEIYIPGNIFFLKRFRAISLENSEIIFLHDVISREQVVNSNGWCLPHYYLSIYYSSPITRMLSVNHPSRQPFASFQGAWITELDSAMILLCTSGSSRGRETPTIYRTEFFPQTLIF